MPELTEVSAQAAALHRSALVADAHNDLLAPVAGRPVDRWVPFFRDRWLPQLVDGGVNLQVLPVFVETRHLGESALRQMLRIIECAHRITAASPETRLCTTAADIEAALEANRIACVLALESAPGVADDVELFETMYRLGVRVASLTHTGRTALADGSEEDATGGRLTRAGADAVAEMNRLGMILDVSHLGIAGVEHVLELSSRPVIATHSAARALTDHHRNLSDAQLDGIAAGGGLVCVNFFGGFIDPDAPTIDHLVDHVEHIRDRVGVETIGLGPDFVQEAIAETTMPCCEDDLAEDRYIPGLEGPRGFPRFTDALLRRGWAEDDIRAVLGENLRRFLVRELDRGRS